MTENQTLLDAATAYTPTTAKTKNIAELGIVSLNQPFLDDPVPDKVTGKVKMQKVVVVNDVKYRVPSPVLEQIQKIIKTAAVYGQTPTKVKVTRSGTTQTDTRYSVEPIKD